MNPQVKSNPDDTRARIMETAEALFRRLGFAKTAVADIAAELKMSPANVYRFFASKNAIVEAICRRCLSQVEEKASAAARAKGPAGQRIERLVLEILAYHKENLLIEHRVNEMVLFAIDHMSDAIAQQGSHPQCRRTDLTGSGTYEIRRARSASSARATADLITDAAWSYRSRPVLGGPDASKRHGTCESQGPPVKSLLLRAITPDGGPCRPPGEATRACNMMKYEFVSFKVIRHKVSSP